MSCKRSEIVEMAQGFIGAREQSTVHKSLIDLYNNQNKLPRGYRVQYTDAWCATFISSLALMNNAQDIIDLECSCGEMIKLATKRGTWVENDAFVPERGDLILYYWNDKENFATTDCKGYPNHIGIVENCCGGKITVIEGNYDNQVKRRVLDVNGKYIRGYITPKYENEDNEKSYTYQDVDYAEEKNDLYKGKYKTTTFLHLRKGANVKKESIRILEKGEVVTCYGYFTKNGSTPWFLVVAERGGVGFCSSKFLKRV